MPVNYKIVAIVNSYVCSSQFVVVQLFDTSLCSIFDGFGEIDIAFAK
jgi:hypothetical protein